jgi:hypothetical protein
LVVLILTTAAPCFCTSGVKSGSAASAVEVCGACVAGACVVGALTEFPQPLKTTGTRTAAANAFLNIKSSSKINACLEMSATSDVPLTTSVKQKFERIFDA